jgi:hypothetical protein
MKTFVLNLREYGHRNILILVEDVILQDDIEFACSLLKARIAEGKTLHPGHCIQIGWLEVMITEDSNDLLTLCEPDFVELPVRWIKGITKTISSLRLQIDSTSSILDSSAVDFPSFRQSAIIGSDVQAGQQEYIFQRSEYSLARDSGWFLGMLGTNLDYNNPANLRRISLYEGALKCPACIQFLAFPAGTEIHLIKSKLEIWISGRKLEAKDNTLLKTQYL